jgi:hypothetical protein
VEVKGEVQPNYEYMCMFLAKCGSCHVVHTFVQVQRF